MGLSGGATYAWPSRMQAPFSTNSTWLRERRHACLRCKPGAWSSAISCEKPFQCTGAVTEFLNRAAHGLGHGLLHARGARHLHGAARRFPLQLGRVHGLDPSARARSGSATPLWFQGARQPLAQISGGLRARPAPHEPPSYATRAARAVAASQQFWCLARWLRAAVPRKLDLAQR